MRVLIPGILKTSLPPATATATVVVVLLSATAFAWRVAGYPELRPASPPLFLFFRDDKGYQFEILQAGCYANGGGIILFPWGWGGE